MSTIYPRLPAEEKHGLLRRIVSRCASTAEGKTPVVVFDLDGTLMDNRPRTVTILRELAEQWATREPEASAMLANVAPERMSYLLTATLATLGVTRSDLVAEAERFWRERFFGDDYMRFDIELAGGVPFARACYDAGAILIYLTGRDLPMMGTGTFRSLRDLGYPIGVPGTEVVLKPDAAMPDEAFKRLEAPRLARVGTVVAVFDNEPANCNALLELNPGADSVLLDTQHLPGAPPLAPGVWVIDDFRMQ